MMSNILVNLTSFAADPTFLPNIQAAGIDWQTLGAWVVPFLRDLITFLILGSLLIWWKPQYLDQWTITAKRSPFKAFGAGILLVFGGYLIVLIVFLLILSIAIFLYFIQFNDLGGIIASLGLPALGVFFGALSLFIAFISKLVVVFLIGQIIFERFYPKALAHHFWPLLLGLVLYLLVRAIPWLGWVVGVVVTLVGLGAIWLTWQKKSSQTNPPTPQVETEPRIDTPPADMPDVEAPEAEGLSADVPPPDEHAGSKPGEVE